jgi:outer membrane protein TolC
MNAKRKSYQIAISLSLALTISLSTFEIVLSQNASQNTSQSSSSTIELTPEYVLELALSSPVFLNEASAKLEKAQGELESARRWWLPSTALGARSFSHSGNALNSDGLIFTEVDSRSAEFGMGFRFNSDNGAGITGIKTSKYALQAAVQELKAERDLFVLACINSYISAIAANKDREFHLTAVEELREFESQFTALEKLGLRPKSDVFIIRAERMQMESQILIIESAIIKILSELRSALGLPEMPEIKNETDKADQNEMLSEWPSIEKLLGVSISSNSVSQEFLSSTPPSRQALVLRVNQAQSQKDAILKDIWVPELRISPMIGGMGREFSSVSLSVTSEWVTSLVFSFSLENLFPGGKNKEADAVVDISKARLSEWDLQNNAYREGAIARLELLKKSLDSQLVGAYVSDLALSDAFVRLSHGLVNSMELMQIERLRLESHSKAVSLTEKILKLEFELITLTNPLWTN